VALYLPDEPLVNPKTGEVESKRWLRLLEQLAVLSFTVLSGQISLSQLVAHATTHQSGGSDAIKLDDLATPDDNTDLNASATRHGLLPKLSGNPLHTLKGDGTWSL
jgi:hypothetical protein